MLGYYVPVLFGGALVVEQLFNYPGMGLLFWNAAQTSDFPVLLGCVLVISLRRSPERWWRTCCRW